MSTGITPGTTIYNGDTQAAVWVSANPTPGPSQGMRIGPKGSLSWTAPGPLYGAPDNGVTAPVVLTLSSNVGSLVNPVDVGAAVAAQLLAQGVPSILLGGTVHTGAITMPATTATPWVLPVSIGAFASIILNITSTKNQYLTATWRDSGTGTVVVSDSYILAAQPQANNGIVLQMDVKSNELAFYFSDVTAAVTVTAYVSNRALPDRVAAPPFYDADAGLVTFGAYQTVHFPAVFTTNGGLRTVRLTPNGAGATGYMGVDLLTAAGAALSVTLLDTSAGGKGAGGEPELTANVNLPAGQYIPWYQNGPTPQTYGVRLSIL